MEIFGRLSIFKSEKISRKKKSTKKNVDEEYFGWQRISYHELAVSGHGKIASGTEATVLNTPMGVLDPENSIWNTKTL